MTAPDELDDHAYFKAIEEAFVQLRGAPLLLSPADWQVARRWHQAGIPLDLVRQTLEEVFAKRREREAKGRVSSLRYVARAVEAAWKERRELTAPGERSAAAPLDVPARLAALAAALPADLPGVAETTAELTGLGGASPEVEDLLATLDGELLDRVWAGLSAEERTAVDAAAERTLAALAGRIDAAELERSRARLRRQLLRQQLGLPVLSLFAPEAEAGESGPSLPGPPGPAC
jgi:hypothetical protein